MAKTELIDLVKEEDFEGLKPKQVLFLKNYLILSNAKDAARKAGYKVEGSNNTGPRLLKNKRIQEVLGLVNSRVAKAASYGLKEYAKELDEFIEKADNAKQYTAVSKLLQNKGAAMGLLDKKINYNDVPLLNITFNGISAASSERGINQTNPVIDVKRVEDDSKD